MGRVWRLSVREVGEVLYIPDSSVVCSGVLRRLVVDGVVQGRLLIIRELITYFENLARSGRAIGNVGLEELRIVKGLCESKGRDTVVGGLKSPMSISSAKKWALLQNELLCILR